MSQRTKRLRPLLKVFLAAGLLGGGGYGAYQFVDVAATPPVDSATLDAAAQAWSEDDASPPPAQSPLAMLNTPPAQAPPAPAAPLGATPAAYGADPLDRYATAAPPLPPMEDQSETIARGQSPSHDSFEDEAPQPNALPNALPEGNPLRPAPSGRYDAGSAPAQQAFEDAEEDSIGPPPAAMAAFDDTDNDHSGVLPVAAVEPIDDLPPAPLGMPPMPQDELNDNPLAALPQAAEEMAPVTPADDRAPAPFTQDAPLGMPPADEPNPLRAASEPAQQALPQEPAYPAATGQAPARFEEPMSHSPQGQPMAAEPRGMRDDFASQPAPGLPTPTPSEGAGRPGERALEGRQQPSLAIQKFAPAEIQVGKPCKFLIKVRNMGQSPALNVVVRDQTPAGVQLTATTPQADVTGDALRWDLGSLAPGEEKTLAMELIPAEEGPIGSVATVSFAAEASVQTNCTRPQLALRMTAPSQVLVGQEQQIQIEIKNPGTGDATGVVILENVPENLRHAAGPTLEFEVGTLRAGETRKMQLNMIAERPGKVVNLLTAQADGNLQVDQQVEFEVVAPALEVAVDGPSKRYLERPATYTVKIGNPGTAAAHDLRLVTRLPRGMRFVKANNLGEYDATSHAVYWSLAELPSGESGAVELTTMPVAAGDQELQVQGEAQNGLRDETVHQTQVEGIAAIKFTVLDLEDPIEIGGETEYEIRVANQGTKAASNVRVQATAPAGIRIVSASGDARHRLQAGAVQFEPIRQLAPQAELTFKLRVQGAQPGDHRLVVEVGSDDLAQPVRKEESTRVFGDE